MSTQIDLEFPVTGLVAGVDEVGRGPLAGPVIAAAVILDPDRPIAGLADSKALSERRRMHLADEIRDHSLAWALGRAECAEIDTINILRASLLAMQRAINALAECPDTVLVDGNQVPEVSMTVRAIIKGDSKVAAISAASILAKVTRDDEMVAMERDFPGYGFARHKGYPTRQHLEALRSLGICPIHRRSFGPVRQLLESSDIAG